MVLIVFNAHIIGQLAKARYYLEGCFESDDPENLHDFRVEIKKIRAAINALLSFNLHKKALKKAKVQVKELFSEVGEIREQQLFLLFLIKHDLQPLVDKLKLEKAIDEAVKNFRKQKKHHYKTFESAFKKIIKAGEQAQYSALREYVKGIKKQAGEQLASNPPADGWHDLRKLLKQNLYAAQWMEGWDVRLVSQQKRERYKHLQHLIGDWHDDTLHMERLEEIKKRLKKKDPHQTYIDNVIAGLQKSIATTEKEIKGELNI